MSIRTVSEVEAAISERARNVLPAGGFGNVTFDLVIREGRGGRVWDESGNEYIDFLLGSGPMLIGHSHPEVVKAVTRQVTKGSTFFTNNESGIRLAEEIVQAVACAEKVRFLSSGSEATFYAMRIARAYRNRGKILKFEGGFHGMSDYALMSMAPSRPGNFPQATPDTAGIPDSVSDEILIAPFNDARTAASLIREHKHELAGVIVEPLQRMIPPEPGFLQALREVTEECEVALIFDEVVTGFRFAYGGAQEYYGVTPDLCTLGKAVAGGFPLTAVTGKSELMNHFDSSQVSDDKFMPQIGTLSGNPIACAAGLAALSILQKPGTYERIRQIGGNLMNTLQEALDQAEIPATVVGEPVLFDVFFTNDEVYDYRTSLKGDSALLSQFNQILLNNGVFKGTTKFYFSTEHSQEDSDLTVAAFHKAIEKMSVR